MKLSPDGVHKIHNEVGFRYLCVSLFTIVTNKFIVGLGVRLRQTCTVHQYCALATLNPVYNSFITAVILFEANCTGLGIHSLALPCILSRVVLAQSVLQTFLFFVEK